MQEQKIRELAHSKWEKAGCPPGDGIKFWLEAEQELTECPEKVCCKTKKMAAKKSAIKE